MGTFRHICTALLAAAMLSAAGCVHAQSRDSKLKFDTQSHDFGSVAEADGPVVHIFNFTNTGSRAVVIEKVNSDCGCTVPTYDRRPIKPGEKGSVEVRMDPANYSGTMRKCVSVISNDGRQQGRDLLCLTAEVTPRPRTLEEEYPLALAEGLRAASLHAPFSYMSNNSSKSETLTIVNSSGKRITLEISSEAGSGYLRADIPRTLGPGEKGTIKLTYDFSGRKDIYGMIADRIYISVNGVRSNLPVNANVIVVEDFSSPDADPGADAHISPVFYNFRAVKPGQTLSKEITVTNIGTAPLIVRDVATRRNTVCDLEAGEVIKPGQIRTITLKMTVPQGAEGSISGGITLIINDPARPMRDIRIAAEAVK